MEAIFKIREFKTRNFRVVIDAMPEYDPDLSWDESGEVAAKIDSGEYYLFMARFRVIHNRLGQLAVSYLGECIYENPQDLDRAYMADFIREVVTEARQAIRAAQSIRVRLPA
jgi:hypothetical protein